LKIIETGAFAVVSDTVPSERGWFFLDAYRDGIKVEIFALLLRVSAISCLVSVIPVWGHAHVQLVSLIDDSAAVY